MDPGEWPCHRNNPEEGKHLPGGRMSKAAFLGAYFNAKRITLDLFSMNSYTIRLG